LYVDTMQQVYSNVSKVLVDSRGNSNLLYLPLDKLIQQAGAASAPTLGAALPSETPPTPPSPSAVDVRSRDGQRGRDRDGR
jgi:membrane protease subunit HflK